MMVQMSPTQRFRDPFLQVFPLKVSYTCTQTVVGESVEKAHVLVCLGPKVDVSVSTHIPLTRARCEATSGCKVKLGNTIPGGKALSRTLF